MRLHEHKIKKENLKKASGKANNMATGVKKALTVALAPVLAFLLPAQSVMLMLNIQGVDAQGMSSYALEPAGPRAGETFRIRIQGSSLDMNNHKVMLLDGSQTTTCGLNMHIFQNQAAGGTLAGTKNIMCNGEGSAPTVLNCGPFTVLEKTTAIRVCVCLQTNCVSEADWTKGGSSLHTIMGPQGNTDVEAQLNV